MGTHDRGAAGQCHCSTCWDRHLLWSASAARGRQVRLPAAAEVATVVAVVAATAAAAWHPGVMCQARDCACHAMAMLAVLVKPCNAGECHGMMLGLRRITRRAHGRQAWPCAHQALAACWFAFGALLGHATDQNLHQSDAQEANLDVELCGKPRGDAGKWGLWG